MLIIFDCRRFQKATITIRHLHQNSEEGIQAIRYKNKDSHTKNKQIGQVNPSPPWSKYPAMRPWFAATIEPRVQYLQSLQRLCKFEPTTIIYMSCVLCFFLFFSFFSFLVKLFSLCMLLYCCYHSWWIKLIICHTYSRGLWLQQTALQQPINATVAETVAAIVAGIDAAYAGYFTATLEAVAYFRATSITSLDDVIRCVTPSEVSVCSHRVSC